MKTAEQSYVHERRLKVAEYRRQGYRHQSEIARMLGVSPATIHGDWKVVDQWWRDLAAQDIAIAKGKDAEIIDELIKSIFPKATDPELKNQNFYIDRVIALIDRRAKLLGLDAPVKLDITDELRRRAVEEGLDPETVVRAAEEYLKATKV